MSHIGPESWVPISVLPSVALLLFYKGYHEFTSSSWKKDLRDRHSSYYPELTTEDNASLAILSSPHTTVSSRSNIGLSVRPIFTPAEQRVLFEDLEALVKQQGVLLQSPGTTRESDGAGVAGAACSRMVGYFRQLESQLSQVPSLARQAVLERAMVLTDQHEPESIPPTATWSCGDALNDRDLPPSLRVMRQRIWGTFSMPYTAGMFNFFPKDLPLDKPPVQLAGMPVAGIGRLRHVRLDYYPSGTPLLLPRQLPQFDGYDYVVVPLRAGGREEWKGPSSWRRESRITKEGSELAAKDESRFSLSELHQTPVVLTMTPSERSRSSSSLGEQFVHSWTEHDVDVLLPMGAGLRVHGNARFNWHLSARPTQWFADPATGDIGAARRESLTREVKQLLSDLSQDSAKQKEAWEYFRSVREESVANRTQPSTPWSPWGWIRRTSSLWSFSSNAQNTAAYHTDLSDGEHEHALLLVTMAFEGPRSRPRRLWWSREAQYFGAPPTAQTYAWDDSNRALVSQLFLDNSFFGPGTTVGSYFHSLIGPDGLVGRLRNGFWPTSKLIQHQDHEALRHLADRGHGPNDAALPQNTTVDQIKRAIEAFIILGDTIINRN